MAGYIRGSKEHKQKMIEIISKDLQKLHEKAPEAHDEISALSSDISHIMNVYMFQNAGHKHRNLFEDDL